MSHAADPAALLAALRAGDPAAPDHFADYYAPSLHATLRKKFPYVPRETLSDAANDALLSFLSHPERYQPERGASAQTFLTAIAYRRVLDRLRSAKRREAREIAVGGFVELELWSAHNKSEAAAAPDPGAMEDPDALSSEVARWLAEVLPEAQDRRLLEIILEGRADVAAAAALLGIAHWPAAQQQAEWKRQRDRVLARIKRRREELRRLV